MGRPHFKNPNAAAVLGVAFLGAAWFCLYDAYDRVGRPLPRWLRPVAWW